MAAYRCPSHAPMKTILLVEDDNHIRLLIRTLLEREGLRVVEAGDGLKGLSAALATPPHCIVTDTMMPHMDGLSMLSRIRAHEIKAPAILVSAAFDLPSGDALAELGISKVVRKPFSLAALINSVLTIVGE